VAFDKFRKARASMDVDLIPVMNLFVVLIPFLLLSAAFFHVGVIPTSLPSQGASSGEAAEPNLAQVTVNLQVNTDHITLSVSNDALAQEVLDQLALELPRPGDGSELPQLQAALRQIKLMYAESDTVVLLPGEGVRYKDVVTVLDAARETVEHAGEANELRTPLFPVVVLSRKV